MKWIETVVAKSDEIPLVEEVKLDAHDRPTGVKAIVDKSTMNTICVVKEENQIIQHQDVLKEVQKLENYTIRKMKLIDNGTKLLIDLTEQTPRKIALMKDDMLECGARVVNDYSKTRGLSVQGSGLRLACTNGVTAPIHTRKMQIFAYGTDEFAPELEAQIEACLNAWVDSAKLIEWANETKVHTKDFIIDHIFLPKKHMESVADKLKDEESLYTIWNVYTEVITHEIAPNVKTFNVIGLEKRANKILTATAPKTVLK